MDLSKTNSIALKGDRKLQALCAGENDTNLLNVITTELYYLLKEISKLEEITFHCFTSDGFDIIAAELLLDLKQKQPSIILIAHLSINKMTGRGNSHQDNIIKQLVTLADIVEFVENDAFDEFADTITNEVSTIITYCSGEDRETTTLVKQAKAKGVKIENLFDNLSNYFTCTHLAKLLMQAYPNPIAFRYSKDGFIFTYDDINPLPVKFKQVTNITCEDKNFTFYLANGLIIKVSILLNEDSFVCKKKRPDVFTHSYLIELNINPDIYIDDDPNIFINYCNPEDSDKPMPTLPLVKKIDV